jgi:signal peptidase II
MSPARRRSALLVGVAATVVALDQWTKSWAQQALKGGPRHVLGPMNLQLTDNRGAAFSFGTGASPVIAAVAVALVLAVAFYSRRLAQGGVPLPVMVALGLLGGGAVSNLADRFFRHHHGAVVDFIQLVSWWPIFNVADAAITIGALTLAVTLVFFPGRDAAREDAASEDAAREDAAREDAAREDAAREDAAREDRGTRAPSGTAAAPGGNSDH